MSNFDEFTLSDYAEQVFFKVIKPDYKPNTQGKIRKAISVLEEWHKEELLVSEVNFGLLKQFELEVSGTNKRSYPEFLWTVMRSAAPDRFPKYHGKRAKEISYASGPTYLLEAFYTQLYEPIALRSRRANTKRLYKITLRIFADFLDRPPTLDDFTDDTLNRFAAWRQEKGKSKNTINRNLTDLIAMWRWAHRKGYVSDLPDIELEKEVKETPVAWKRDELDRIFESVRQEEGRISGVPASVFWTALLLMFWDTGERVSAVRGLTWEHIDLDDCWVHFKAENRKGGSADNARRLGKDTRACLESMRRWQVTAENYSPDALVFQWEYSNSYIYRAYARILKRAGLPSGKMYKFHCLRKTVASHFEKAGGNATELLCHYSRAITKCYLDPRIVERTEAVDLLFRPKVKKEAKTKKKPK